MLAHPTSIVRRFQLRLSSPKFFTTAAHINFEKERCERGVMIRLPFPKFPPYEQKTYKFLVMKRFLIAPNWPIVWEFSYGSFWNFVSFTGCTFSAFHNRMRLPDSTKSSTKKRPTNSVSRNIDLVKRVSLMETTCPCLIIGKLLQVPNYIQPFTPPPPLRD